jgi:hypothetical protein
MLINKKQTVEWLKQIRDTEGIVADPGHPLLEEALQHFRLKAPDCEKFACIHNPDAQLVVVDWWRDRWRPGQRRFECKSNDIQSCVTYKLTKSTSHAQLSKACRNAVDEDLPDWLRRQRRPGIELDHSRIDFCEIVREFAAKHPNTKPHKAGERWVLATEHKQSFQKLHHEWTNEFRDIVPRTVEDHREVTQSRRLQARELRRSTAPVDLSPP